MTLTPDWKAEKHPRAEAGRFGVVHQSASEVSLQAPTANAAYISSWMEASRDHQASDATATASITEKVNASRNFSDENIGRIADEVWREQFGYTALERVRFENALHTLRATGADDAADAITDYVSALGGKTAPPSQAEIDNENGIFDGSSDAVRMGMIVDTIRAEDGSIFHRRRPGTHPDQPNQIRLQASRELDESEVQVFAGLVGYAYRAEIRGESMSEAEQDSPYSFIIGAESKKSRSDDIGMAFERFEDSLEVFVREGSPMRTTNQAGPDTKGTRLIEGFGPSFSFELYYDDVC